MSAASVTTPSELYKSRKTRYESEAARLSQRSRLMSNLRGLSFGSGLLCGIAALAGAARSLCVPLACALFVAFAVFVVLHGRVLDALDLAERWVDVNQGALSRLEHAWAEIADNGQGLAPSDHPYANDLNLFGKGSLFQRLSVARTRFGRERLSELLLEAAALAEVKRRQAAVAELARDLELRQRFEAHALGVAGPRRSRESAGRTRIAPNPSALIAWAESEPSLLADPLSVWGARIFPPLTVAALIGTLGFGWSAAPLALAFVLHALVLIRSQREANQAFSAVSSTEGAFLRYGTLLEIIESTSSEDPLLSELRERLTTAAGAPSLAMTRFRRIVGWFDLRHNALVYPFVNLLFLWDTNCTLALERWQRGAGKHLRAWFDVIGWFEALSSLASFAADEPGVSFPELLEDTAAFRAEGLAHPLLAADKRVPNDVELPGPGSALLVTGSNMSGKSTLLRALGVTAVLALAGSAVTTRRLRISKLRVASSIQIADSLEAGVSHFLAEVNKLKQVVDLAHERGPVLFLLDEILHGTNSRERQIGARWVIGELIRSGALGAVSTHDQELCRLPPELMQHVALVHLRESIDQGRMTFDFRVYEGPVTTGNALRLMRSVGLEVPLE